LLGKGGMGEVYEAEDTVKDRIVALKLLPEWASHDPVFRKRLQREAHSAGRLQEPHVVPIHDYGEVDGLLYVDMRMIDGTDLRKVLKRFGPMTPARAVAIVRQIASALDAAHESGVMHRDVKPENVLITRDDFAYLVDFGIANAATDEKLTELGTAVGTYAYMAPERFTNDEVTYRADVYALTCVLHECLTGAQPYQGDSVSVVITAHLMQPIPKPSEQRPGIPAAFDTVIAKGMGKKPEDRYASAGDLAIAANDALSERDQDQAATILQRGPLRRRHQGELRAFPVPGQRHRLADHLALPANVEGRIACGTYNNGPDLVWSKNADLLLADAQRPNMDDLHKWWLKYG
jgi:serine/threonine-protein kinase